MMMGTEVFGEATGDYFGSNSVDISAAGTRIVTGAPQHNNACGQVYIYDFINGNWVKTKSYDWKTVQDNSLSCSQDTHSGNGVSISDDGVRILFSHDSGFITVDVDASGNKIDWKSVSKPAGSETSVSGTYGIGIAISGDGSTVAIGDHSTLSGDTENRGRVWLYELNGDGTAWLNRVSADGSTWYKKSKTENFGRSLTLSTDGSVLAVGEPAASTDSLKEPDNVRGLVRVYNTVDTR